MVGTDRKEKCDFCLQLCVTVILANKELITYFSLFLSRSNQEPFRKCSHFTGQQLKWMHPIYSIKSNKLQTNKIFCVRFT